MKKYFFLIFIVVLLFFFFKPVLKFKKVKNENPLPSFYKKGVYHVHSLYSSDSTGKIEDILKAAQRNNLDFVILTDHGRPNLKSSWILKKYGKVLLIGASEFGLDCGHMTAMNFKRHPYRFAPEPQSAIDEVNEDGGFEFIAHPFDSKIPWTNWNVKNYSGIEVINSYSCIRRCSLLKKIISFFYYQIDPIFSLIYVTESFNHKNFYVWDSINKGEKCYGIFGLDAHGRFNISKKIHLNFPKYRDMFGLFNIYVKVKNVYSNPNDERGEILDGLKRGNFFNVVEGLGSANGFDTFFVTKSGEKVEMGETVDVNGGNIFFKLPFNFKTKIKIYRDGKPFRKIVSDKKEIKVKVSKKGVYRSEIYLTRGIKNIPWIVTNPFFIGVDYGYKKFEREGKVLKFFKFSGNFFKVRKDGGSCCSFNLDKKNKSYILKYHLSSKENEKIFGVSIYHKVREDIFNFSGISFETRSQKRMRYFFVLRYGNKCFRRSFLSGKNWERVNIDFSSLVECSGDLNERVDLKKVKFMLFSLNNYITYDGFYNKFYLRNLALY